MSSGNNENKLLYLKGSQLTENNDEKKFATKYLQAKHFEKLEKNQWKIYSTKAIIRFIKNRK